MGVQNNQRSFFGIIIYEETMKDKRLSLTDKFVYSYIVSYSRFCADSNARIAERLGVGVRSVIRSVGRLQELGLVEVRFGARSTRKIYRTTKSDCGKLVENPVEKSVENPPRGAKMARGCAKMATLKTGKGVPKWLPKNKRIKKNNSSREGGPHEMTAGLAGSWPASRHGKKRKMERVESMGELLGALYQFNRR